MKLSDFWQSKAAFELGKSAWLLGSLLSTLHALTTMAFYHQFQHQLAFEETARQTEQLIGISAGVGIYFNYVFVLVWLADAMWLCGYPKSYESRHKGFDWLFYGFIIFIAFNGAIVFESGMTRWFSLLAIVILATTYFLAIRQRAK